ncbi:MAG: hypothetical protein ACYDBH_21740, partial [Acidobacteriaceae bacterium]
MLHPTLRSVRWVLVSLLLLPCSAALAAHAKISVSRTSTGVIVRTPTDTMRITVCGAASVHVVVAPPN